MPFTSISREIVTSDPDQEAILVFQTGPAIQVPILGPKGFREVVGGIDFFDFDDLTRR